MIRKPKRINPRGRDEYKAMCFVVRKRDGKKCQMPGCTRNGQEVHHVKRWADSTHTRYNPNFCILLCKSCHKKVTGQEGIYAALFIRIIGENTQKQNKKKQ